MDEVFDILRMLWPLLVFQFALFAWAIIDLIRRSQVKVLPKWAWALIILFVNFFGPIIYLILGRGEE